MTLWLGSQPIEEVVPSISDASESPVSSDDRPTDRNMTPTQFWI